LAADLRAVYAAPTLTEDEQALARFSERWDAKYPAISPSWRVDWQRLTVFFDYSPEIRKVIYTTNAIESLNYSLRKLLKTRGAFPNDEAIIKIIYLAINRVAKKWTMPIRDWRAALNQFGILFGDRVPVWKEELEELGRCFIVDFFQASAAPQTLAGAINSGS
jgi:putative transposase